MTRFFLAIALMMTWLTLPASAKIDIQQVTSPGGIKAWLVEDHTLPFTSLEIRFRGGASLDPATARGATNLMVGLLEEGTGDMDAQAFARARDALGANFSYDVGDDAVSVSARFLTENRDTSIALLRQSLVAPRFDQTSIDRVRGQVLSVIRSDKTKPRSIAGRAFDKLVFGNHPYATSPNGTEDSVNTLTRADIVAAHKGALARDRIYVAAAGDIDASQLGKMLDTLLGDLPATGAPLPEKAKMNLPGGVKVVPFDTPQSVAVFAQKGLDRKDPDFFPAFVLNRILGGGGFESRLMTEVRVKRGLSYGVYSYLSLKDHAKLWAGSTASGNDRVAKAVEVIRDVWKQVHDKGVTQKELDDAKTYLTGAYPLQFDGNGSIADIAVSMQKAGLPADYIATRNDKINAVTLDEVNRIARKRLAPDTLTFVVVGQPKGLKTTIN